MRQLTYVRKGVLEWREAPEPRLLAAAEAIVRPFIAARCDGDCLPLFHSVTARLKLGLSLRCIEPVVREMLGRNPFKGPTPFGHECIAQVIECGDDVRSVKKGDAVIVPWAISCGQCFTCGQGLTSNCERSGTSPLAAYGFGESMGPWGGAVSDRLRVPYADAMLVRVPSDLDPLHVASASDNIPDGWRMVAPHLQRYPGAPVLIVGGSARSIGLYAAGVAVAMNSSRVDYLDFSAQRLQIAEALGANAIQIPRDRAWLRRNAPRKAGPYLVSADASASIAGLSFALRSLAPGGICTGVGYYFFPRGPLPLMQMYASSVTLHIGVSHPRADLPQILRLIQAGRFHPEKVTSLVAPWEAAPEAFLEDTTKVIVRRDPIGTA